MIVANACRLLRKGRPVGYQVMGNGKIYHSEMRPVGMLMSIGLKDVMDVTISENLVLHNNFIHHDSMEPGLYVDGKDCFWWFGGDVGYHGVYGLFVLRWDEKSGEFYLALGKAGLRGRVNHAKSELSFAKFYRTIYELEDDESKEI